MDIPTTIFGKALANLITEDRTRWLLSNLFPWGSRPQILDGMPFPEIIQRIRAAKSELLILQTWLSIWNDLECEIPKVMEKHDNFRVQMIYADPDIGIDGMCERRGAHSGLSSGEATQHTKVILKMASRLRLNPTWGHRMDLCVTNELPTCATIKIDDTIYFTPFLMGRTTRHTFTLKFSNRNRPMAEHALSHFRRVSKSPLTRRYEEG